MKTKQQLMDALTAKGVDFPATANKALLEELALANGIPLDLEGGETKDKPAEGAAPQDDSELIAAKMAAGLSYEGAVEVIKRQREWDAKAKA